MNPIVKRIIVGLDYRHLLNFVPDKTYLKLIYRVYTGRHLNLDEPKLFTEKLQWIKLYDRNPFYTVLVDKVLVKEHVAKLLGEKYIIPTIGVWDNPDDIDFDTLPSQFVLKCNHNSGRGMCICTDKSSIKPDRIRQVLREGLKENYYITRREWPYKNVPRKVLAEKYMEDESGFLQDYKVMCFHGEPKIIQVHKGRFSGTHTQDLYDIEWNILDFDQMGCIKSSDSIARPACLNEMLSASRVLSSGIPHVRVDWYIINGQLFFGEMTFFDASGLECFEPYEKELEIGSWIRLGDQV